ncbi:UrcA family protein [Allosphingosinicella indica]|uniref:UrcA family protein n=1 Tax=Allosphingosinicella indica TaxID=941907 RepID=A0A1X7H2C7_9SPHN|nr:UrcA family protein [Allosphingosinicella indica]SMF78465.1 UrcA family protein [Allosphingosinicella indica]
MRNALFLLALTGAAVTAPASAQLAAQPSLVVLTVDLDLTSANGRARLDQRIARAVREVCGHPSDADAEGRSKVRECRDATLAAISEQRAIAIAAAERPVRLAGSQ